MPRISLKKLQQFNQPRDINALSVPVIGDRCVRVSGHLRSELLRASLLLKFCGGVVSQQMVLRQTMLAPEPRKPTAEIVT